MRRLPFVPDVSAACLDGHFPGRPVIPGVVLLEAAIAAAGLNGPVRIEQAKFVRPCLPGLALELVLNEREAGGVDLHIESEHGRMASARLRPLAAAESAA